MPQGQTEEKPRKAHVERDTDMACLKGKEEFPQCQVEKPIADLLFVTAKPLPSCRYIRFFGEGVYCTCPVRKELYKRHKV